MRKRTGWLPSTIHNAVRRALDQDGDPTDPAQRRSHLASINDLLDPQHAEREAGLVVGRLRHRPVEQRQQRPDLGLRPLALECCASSPRRPSSATSRAWRWSTASPSPSSSSASGRRPRSRSNCVRFDSSR
jgi:hypothetical protein